MNLKYLVIHTTDTPQSWSLQRLNSYFRDLFNVRKENRGYHIVIEANGKVNRRIPHLTPSSYAIRNFEDINNSNSEHIAYIGGNDGKGNARDNRTIEQRSSMWAVVQWYIEKYPDILILGHNQIALKACPCFKVPEWLIAMGVSPKNVYTRDNFNVLKHLKF